MKTAVFAATDLVFNTAKEKFYYPKGAMIQLEVGTDSDVYIVYHRLTEIENDGSKKENTVVSTNLRVVRMEDLHFILDSTIFESQLSSSIDLKDVKIDEALFSERLTPAMISRYLTDAMTTLEKSYVKDNAQYIRLPIRTKKEALTAKEKVSKVLRSFDPMEAENLKSDDILSIDARAEGNANDTGYLISTEALLGNTNADMLSYLETKLVNALPTEWRIRRTKEGRVKIETHGARPAALNTLLSTLPIKTSVNIVNQDGDLHYEVAVVIPEQKPVIETYYTKLTTYKKFKVSEDKDKPEEGDDCTSEDGKKGTLKKQGDSLVCVVKEAYLPNFREEAQEGDPCTSKDDKKGVMKKIGDNLVCVVKDSKITHFPVDASLSEGDEIEHDGKRGRVIKDENGKLLGQISEIIEIEAFTAPMVKIEAEFGGDSEGSNSASPAPGDPCDYQGQAGTLKLVNGALVCSLGSELPNGAEGAN